MFKKPNSKQQKLRSTGKSDKKSAFQQMLCSCYQAGAYDTGLLKNLESPDPVLLILLVLLLVVLRGLWGPTICHKPSPPLPSSASAPS